LLFKRGLPEIPITLIVKPLFFLVLAPNAQGSAVWPAMQD